MTHLVIENQNSNVEIVNAAIILKLYELALDVELNEGDVSLKGNLLADHAKLTAYDYLIGNLPDSNNKRFPLLTINIPLGGLYIDFVDPEVERILLANNIGDGIGISISMANAVTGTLDGNYSPFMNNTTITSFDELSYFNYNSCYSSLWEKGVFAGCSNLVSVDFSKFNRIYPFTFKSCSKLKYCKNFSGTTIDNFAFLNCSLLENINLSNVTSIGTRAFESCTSLTTVNLSSCTTFRDGVFKACTSLANVTWPTQNFTIEGSNNAGVFQGCSALTSANLSNCTSIGPYAFYQCRNLLTITAFNLNITSIKLAAFCTCPALSDTIDLTNITSVEAWGFSTCGITFTGTLNNLTSVGQEAFYNCSGILGELNLLSLTHLEPGAFNSTGITKIKSLGSITSIPASGNAASSRTFGACTSLIEADLSTTPITSVGGAAFVGDSNLTLIKLPSTLTYIGDWAFSSGVAAPNRIYVIYATTPPDFASATYGCVTRTLGKENASDMGAIYVPDGSVETYKTTSGWSIYASVIDSINNMPST